MNVQKLTLAEIHSQIGILERELQRRKNTPRDSAKPMGQTPQVAIVHNPLFQLVKRHREERKGSE